jgi:hypothetical protein
MRWLMVLIWFLDGEAQAQAEAEPAHEKVELLGRLFCGYQGWFTTPSDGADLGWTHYGFEREGEAHIDLWPDVRELGVDERFETPLKLANGEAAEVYSASHPRTIGRHFEWLREHGIDGVFLQRFGTVLKSEKQRAHADKVLEGVRAASRKTGRGWAVMYDLTGLKGGEILQHVMEDWKRLRNVARIHEDPFYLHHQGRPLVAVWGIGFGDGRAYTLEETAELLRFLSVNPEFGGMATLAGVPTWWRTGGHDATEDGARMAVFRLADVISPWSVGRYASPEQAEQQIARLQPGDLAWCEQENKAFLPVIFPGFSWRNLSAMRGEEAPLNAIPRLRGVFLWSQARARLKHGAQSLYVAMFDEMDEATAIFKAAPEAPVHRRLQFVNEPEVTADHYLRLTGLIRQAVHDGRLLPVVPP